MKASNVLSFVLGGLAVFGVTQIPGVHAQAPNHVYELRMYHASEGKLDDIKKRFRDHTIRIFDRLNMKSVGYWIPQDGADHNNLLIYVLEHPSREEANKNWATFNADPEWQKVKAASEVNGKLVDKVDRYFMDPADFSKLK